MCRPLLLLLALLGCHGIRDVSTDRLVGWKGESHRSTGARRCARASPSSGGPSLTPRLSSRGEQLQFVTLPTGARFPRIGFGTAGLTEGTRAAVAEALEAGYRLFDSAQAREWYREDLVGEALAASSLPREQLWLTSKVHPRHLGYAATARQIKTSLSELRTEYLDLLLLHYPECWGDLCGGATPEGTWRDSWRALEAALAAGTVRHIGVSNFDARQLRELLDWAVTAPAVVQAHADPFAQNRELQQLCRERGIVFQAYSSLGLQWWGRYQRNPVLVAEAVAEAAGAHGRSPAQVVLRWALQRGQCIIPKSANREHMEANLDLWTWSLSEDELAAIDALDGRLPAV